MAYYDNLAFNAMKKGDADKDLTGGAIEYSQFEMDMSPKEQAQYKKALMQVLDVAYRNDPHKGKLKFNKWIDNLNPELIKERALKWEGARADKNIRESIKPEEADIINEAYGQITRYKRCYRKRYS